MGGPLGDAVGAVCAELRPALSPAAAGLLDQVVSRLDGPLQLAVAGRITSGKSTVVNALIGRRVAPTDVRECTRLVTRFRYGTVGADRGTAARAQQHLGPARAGPVQRTRPGGVDPGHRPQDRAGQVRVDVVSAGERDRLRQELSGVADRVVGVVTQIDALLPALRGVR
ncbi:MAG TPA: dynamin family protein [Mycobacteriales bacterium]|nr:dynamin family protein [Mycobacteriales bacterium]